MIGWTRLKVSHRSMMQGWRALSLTKRDHAATSCLTRCINISLASKAMHTHSHIDRESQWFPVPEGFDQSASAYIMQQLYVQSCIAEIYSVIRVHFTVVIPRCWDQCQGSPLVQRVSGYPRANVKTCLVVRNNNQRQLSSRPLYLLTSRYISSSNSCHLFFCPLYIL